MQFANARSWRDWAVRKEVRPAWLVLAVSLVATTLFCKLAQDLERVAQEARLQTLSQTFSSEIDRRMTAYRQMLRAGAGLFSTRLDVDRSDWQAFVSQLGLQGFYPGTSGLGFSMMIAPGALAEHERTYSAIYKDRYRVNPQGKRDTYSAIVMLEPDTWRNRRAIGFDMYSEPRRRAAMDAAVATGQVTLTRQVTLLQDTDSHKQAGVILYFPVFSSPSPGTTPAQRMKQLKGFVYAPIRVPDFMGDVIKTTFPEDANLLRFEVFDGNPSQDQPALFDSSADNNAMPAGFTTLSTYGFNGTDWTIRATSKPAFDKLVASRNPDLILGVGLLSTLLLWALASTMGSRRIQDAEAKEQSAMLTRELSHRVRNTLAIVQSVANRSLTDDRTVQEGRDVFLKRLHALARAHTFLLNNAWRGADVAELVKAELATYEDRAIVKGAAIVVSPHLTQSISLIVHELAMNAAKFGALSNGTGKVHVEWFIRPDDPSVLSFSWKETGGPVVSVPSRAGFGQVLLKKTVGAGATAEPVITYCPEGLSYQVDFKLERDAADTLLAGSAT